MTQTIEQLTARIAELEAENERLKVATNFGKSKDIHRLTEVVLSDCGISTEYRPLLEKIENRLYEFFDEQLAASQLRETKMRKLLGELGLDAGRPESDLDKFQQYVEIDRSYVKKIRKALAIPRDTSALDAYVAAKMKAKDLLIEVMGKQVQEFSDLLNAKIATLRKQRDLAVEALKSCGVNDGLNGPTQYFDEDLVERAIKESEGK